MHAIFLYKHKLLILRIIFQSATIRSNREYPLRHCLPVHKTNNSHLQQNTLNNQTLNNNDYKQVRSINNNRLVMFLYVQFKGSQFENYKNSLLINYYHQNLQITIISGGWKGDTDVQITLLLSTFQAHTHNLVFTSVRVTYEFTHSKND